MSEQFREDQYCCMPLDEIQSTIDELKEHRGSEETRLKQVKQMTYIAFHKSRGRTENMKELYENKITVANLSHYILDVLLPEFETMRSEGKLKQTEGQ